MTTHDIVSTVTAQILEQLEQGVAPWHKPWKSSFHNHVTKKEYRGINVFILSSTPHAGKPGGWLTYRQAQQLGGNVKKGERGTSVVFWKFFKTVDEKTEKTKTVPFLRYYTVFHASQCEGLPEYSHECVPTHRAQELIDGFPSMPTCRVGTEAYYQPKTDCLTMPSMESFETSDHYYSTYYHELAHATGHESRLNRPELTNIARFGSESYSLEELTAEMTAAFCCHATGIVSTVPQSASYLQGWLKVLKAEPRLLLQAAGKAQKAFDYITGRTFQTDEDSTED